MPQTPLLQPQADALWTATVDHGFMGLAFGARATIIRLPSGGLWVHSPVPLTDPLRAEVDALGPVTALICPNKFHHLYAGQWAAAYPEAVLFGAQGLAKKRADLRFDAQLGDDAPPAWEEVIQLRTLPGDGPLNESVFHHIPSGTLIVTDLVLHIAQGSNALTRFYLWVSGIKGKVATSPAVKPAIRDRPGARNTMDEVLGWQWDRLIMAHGDVVPTGGASALREALQWL